MKLFSKVVRARPQIVNAKIDADWKDHAEAGAERAQISALVHLICTPPTRRWAFLVNGKSGTSTVLDLLFRIEFGQFITTSVRDPNDLNTANSAHDLVHAGVFRLLAHQELGLSDIAEVPRLVTVRHPSTRALSGFRYLCRSHELSHPAFRMERLRLSAETKFDWTRDCGTIRGFNLFLDWIEAGVETDWIDVNPHWRPQSLNAFPKIYRPDVVGKREDLPAFVRALSERLAFDADELIGEIPTHNVQSGGTTDQILSDEGVARRLRTVFAADFENFGYDPNLGA